MTNKKKTRQPMYAKLVTLTSEQNEYLNQLSLTSKAPVTELIRAMVERTMRLDRKKKGSAA